MKKEREAGHRPRLLRRLGVVGAGNMGSGIAQKMATESFPVILVDVDRAQVEGGLRRIAETLEQAVERRIFTAGQAEEIRGRIKGETEFRALYDCDLVVEAVFEDLEVKKQVFGRLDELCTTRVKQTGFSPFSGNGQ